MSKKVTVAFIIVTVTIGTILLTYIPLINIDNDLVYTNTYKVSDIEECNINRTEYCIPNNRRSDLVALNSNWRRPLSPKYTIVMNENVDPNGEYNYVNALVVELKRDSIFDTSYRVAFQGYNAIQNIGFTKTAELAKYNDIYNNNPDEENIRNIPPATDEEVKISQQVQESANTNQAIAGDIADKINRAQRETDTEVKRALFLEAESETLEIINALENGETITRNGVSVDQTNTEFMYDAEITLEKIRNVHLPQLDGTYDETNPWRQEINEKYNR